MTETALVAKNRDAMRPGGASAPSEKPAPHGGLAAPAFSAFVHIQEDRQQMVIDQGPYRVIRHPGNLSMILWALGIPLTLGSAWALIPAALAMAVVVQRTALEDSLLQAKLPGYRDYAERVPYRLIPDIW